jgi:DNA-binding NarL/FixJ family response regulator
MPTTVPAPAFLGRREMQVARCVCRGLTDKDIARELAIWLPSVRTDMRRLFGSLQ